MTSSYVGKRATAEWLNTNAPIGTVVLNHSKIKYICKRGGNWRGDNNTWGTFPLREDDYGYKIIRWGDPWFDLEWVAE